MTRKGRRLALIGGALAVVGVAVGLALYAMSDSIALFLSPSEIVAQEGRAGSAAAGRRPGRDRLGRQIRRRALDLQGHRRRQQARRRLRRRLLRRSPDLFREGQGVVAEGVLAAHGRLRAETILAKHDERYMPREVVEALKKQGRWQEGSAKP